MGSKLYRVSVGWLTHWHSWRTVCHCGPTRRQFGLFEVPPCQLLSTHAPQWYGTIATWQCRQWQVCQAASGGSGPPPPAGQQHYHHITMADHALCHCQCHCQALAQAVWHSSSHHQAAAAAAVLM